MLYTKLFLHHQTTVLITSKQPTWLQRIVPNSQADKSCAAVLQNISEGLSILVLHQEMQAATPLLILQTQCNEEMLHDV